MRNTLIIAYILLVIFSSTVYAQQDWTTYHKTIVDNITEIEFDGDRIWLVTNSGLAVYDTITGECKPYTVDDGLVSNIVNDIAVDYNGVAWIVTDKGIATRTKLSEFRVSNRGTKGTRAMFLNEKNGNTVATKMVEEDDLVFILTKLGQGGLVPVNQIRLMGRSKSGTKLMSLNDGDEVVGII